MSYRKNLACLTLVQIGTSPPRRSCVNRRAGIDLPHSARLEPKRLLRKESHVVPQEPGLSDPGPDRNESSETILRESACRHRLAALGSLGAQTPFEKGVSCRTARTWPV